jgi:anthranilate phosphoribosyltransferase
MVVHSDDGLDEISIAANTHVAELRNGEVVEYEIRPADLGIQEAALTDLSVDSAEQSLALIKSALGKDDGDIAQKARSIITINAAAAIYVSGLADSLKAGVSMAEDAIGSGLALAKMSELASFSQVFKED